MAVNKFSLSQLFKENFFIIFLIRALVFNHRVLQSLTEFVRGSTGSTRFLSSTSFIKAILTDSGSERESFFTNLILSPLKKNKKNEKN